MKPEKQKRKVYPPEVMAKALEAVQTGTSINTASRMYNVPRSSLHSKVTKKYQSERSGPPTVFTSEEEQHLVDWILKMCKLGCPVTKDHLLNSVAVLVKKSKTETPFTNDRPGRHWYQAFLRRHPQLKIRLSENVSLSRALVTENSVRIWFSEVKCYLEKKNLLHLDPSRIFNTDETAVCLNPKGGVAVLAEKGSKNVYSVVDRNEKENLTVLVTGNTAGQLAPTMTLFYYKRIPSAIYTSMPKDFIAGTSDSGWMCANVFYEYIANKFFPWIKREKIELPVILFVDGHASHLSQPLSEFCHTNQIVLVVLPPNTTHFMQPMDVSMFAAFKTHWRKAVNEYRIQNTVLSVSKVEFSPLLAKVFKGMDLFKILSNGFKVCGLHPFTPDGVDFTKVFLRSENNEQENTPVTPIQNNGIVQKMEKYINPTTLEMFKSCNSADEWSGSTDDRNLFYVWKSILNESDIQNHSIEISTLNTNTLCNSSSSQLTSDPDIVSEGFANETTSNSVDNLNGNANTIEQNIVSVQEAFDQVYVRPDCTLLSVSDGNIMETSPVGERTEPVTEMIILNNNMNSSDELNGDMNMTFYVYDNGNVLLDGSNDLPSSQNLLTNETVSNEAVNENAEKTINNKNRPLQDIQNLTQNDSKSNDNVPSQFKQFLFWPKEITSKKTTRPPKVKLPSILSSEEGIQYYTEQNEKKRKIEEEKELKRKIRIENKKIKQEIEEKKKEKKKEPKKKSTPKTKSTPKAKILKENQKITSKENEI